MRRNKLLSLAAALALLVTVLSGCGGQPGKPTGSNPSANGSTPNVNPAGDVTYKSTVTIGTDGAIYEINPFTMSNWTHNWVFKMIYDRLVSVDSATFEVHPELATSWEWTSDTVLEIKLRNDVDFHNGDHMTAEDIVWSFQRMQQDDATVTNTMLKGLEKIEALDEYSVRMTLSAPNVDWMIILAHPSFAILNRNAVEADSSTGYYVGTGAFRVETMLANDTTTLIRNDAYWGDKPITQKMILRYIAEDAARLISLQTGEIDVCARPSTLELGYIEDDPKLDLVQFNSVSEVYLAFNTTKFPGNDKNFRLAVAYALNLDEIIEIGANGYATTTATYWGPNTYGRNDKIEPYGQNLELAKEYLNKAFPNGNAELTISTTGNERVTVAQVIQEQLRAIGLTVKVNEVESAAMSAMSKFDVAEHEAMVYNFGWLSQGDDVRRPFHPNQNTNKAIVTNDRIIELIDNAVKEFDESARTQMYAEIQEINHEEAYYLPIYFADQFAGVKAGTTGVIWEPNRAYDFTYIAVPE